MSRLREDKASVLVEGASEAVANRPRSRPVTPAYTSPFKFTGVLEKVVVDVSGERSSTRRPSCARTWRAGRSLHAAAAI